MTFTVVWKPAAEGTLAEIWLASASCREVASAANEIDTVLRGQPLSVEKRALLLTFEKCVQPSFHASPKRKF
jgi:hypothetical protein